MSELTYTTRELTPQEAEAITKDIQEVLEKHNCEIGVKAAIEILKREEVQDFLVPPNGDSTTEEDKKSD